ncbi:MAG: hypothetical protein ACOC1F_11870 [Myxococcota bacterium]
MLACTVVDVATLSGLWPWLAASFGALVGFELIRHWIRKSIRSLRHRWIARRALRGEAHAEALLAGAGYEVVDRQVERGYLVRLDGRATRVVVRADLLVRDPQGTMLVAEVKPGREAPRIENSATRRQLLEYKVAFDAPGVLLVDAGADTISEVRFPAAAEGQVRPALRLGAQWLTTGFVLGVVGALGVLLALGRLNLSLP